MHMKSTNLPILVAVERIEGVDSWGTCSETFEIWDSDWLMRFMLASHWLVFSEVVIFSNEIILPS